MEQSTTSKLSVITLILGILSIFTLGLMSIPTIILGHLSRYKIKKSKGELSGKGMALSGLIIAYSTFIIFIGPMIVTPLVVVSMVKSLDIPASSKDFAVETPKPNNPTKKVVSSNADINEEIEYIINGLQCNLSKEKGTRYIRFDIALVLKDEKFKGYFSKNNYANKKIKNKALGEIVKLTSMKSVIELDGIKNKQLLANEIKDRLNLLLKEESVVKTNSSDVVKDLYFPKFLVQ